MSFSKARIQRFNESENDVPPPGAYDPKCDIKVKGLVIEKSERFNDNKSVCSAEYNLSLSNKSTGYAVAGFRTPQLPRKRIATTSASKGKLKYEPEHHLVDLQVECSNKDKTIYEQGKHIEDMKEEVLRLQLQLEELHKKQIEVEEQHRKDIDTMLKLQQEVLNGHGEKYEAEMEHLRCKLLEVSDERKSEILARQEMEGDMRNRIADFSNRVTVFETKLANKKYTNEEKIQNLATQIKELEMKQEQLTENHNHEVNVLELDRIELNSCINNLTDERDKLELQLQERQSLILELQIQLSAFQREISELKDEYAKHIEDYGNEINDLTCKHQKEIDIIKELETEKLELNSCINNLIDERDKLELKLQERQNTVLELQAQVSTLQSQLDKLKAEYEKHIEECEKQVNDLAYTRQEEINKLTADFEKEKDILLTKNKIETGRRMEIEAKVRNVDETNDFLKGELYDVQGLYKDVNSRLMEAEKELEESDRKHHFTLQKHMEHIADMITLHGNEKLKLEQQLEDIRLDYMKEIETLSIARDREIAELKETTAKQIDEETKRIKEHADKRIEDAEAVTKESVAACRTANDERVKSVIVENDTKVNAMIRETKAAVEEEMRLTAERYEACLARVEMEQAALDEKLVHKDAEIIRLAMIFEELKSTAETQENSGQSLSMELDRAESELTEKKEELRALKNQIRLESAELVARRKRFEIIMVENQASVAALTNHLTHSNTKVEHLQYELKRDEDFIYEHHNLLRIMRNNSQKVYEQVHALMEQLDAKKELINQLEVNSLKEVELIKSVFDAKIEDIKQTASKEVTKLQADCDVKDAQNAKVIKQFHEMANRLHKAQDMLLKLEQRNDAQELKVSQVELLNSKLEEQLKENTAAAEEVNKLLEAQSVEHTVALSKANSKIRELTDKIKHLEEETDSETQHNAEFFEEEKSKWKTFEKAIMEELEEVKARREAAEEEVKKLTECNERLTRDYQEISEKYAEVVGHQNHRQRIKHVSQLKDKINQLEQDLDTKMRIIKQQQKLIEKLKAEDKCTHGKGKENMLGLPRSPLSIPLSVPPKSLTPLRNRND